MMVHEATTPPIIIERDGVFYVEITLGYDVVIAPIGNGRQFASRVMELIVLPAIAPRPTDPLTK